MKEAFQVKVFFRIKEKRDLGQEDDQIPFLIRWIARFRWDKKYFKKDMVSSFLTNHGTKTIRFDA